MLRESTEPNALSFDAPYNFTLENAQPLNADLNQPSFDAYPRPSEHNLIIRVISNAEHPYYQNDVKQQSKMSFVQSESVGSKTVYSSRLKSIQSVRAKVRSQIKN